MTNDNDCTKPGNTSRAAPTPTPCAEPDDNDNQAVQAWPPYAELMLDDEPF